MFTKHLPRPATVIAIVALFVALSGTAVAAGVVPLAKRALVADNAKKLGGHTATQLAAGFAVALPNLVTVRSQSWSLAPGGGNTITAPCQTGEKAISGGFANSGSGGAAIAADTHPSSDDSSWQVLLINVDSTNQATGTVYAVCLS